MTASGGRNMEIKAQSPLSMAAKDLAALVVDTSWNTVIDESENVGKRGYTQARTVPVVF